jgi:hypothetical protein
MGTRNAQIEGINVDASASLPSESGLLGGGDIPGILGSDAAIPLDTGRTIAKVTKDWDPPSPNGNPEIVVNGKTLEEAAKALDKLPEWGQGGGMLRTDVIPPGNSTDLTVKAHANLVYRLPRWAQYPQASPAAKAEWDRMVAKLKEHEDRHLQIAIEEADQLASDLVGHDIADIAKMVTEANRRMATRQQELDNDTDHGAKEGVKYGDVVLDISIK